MKLVVPLTIPKTFAISVTPKLSWIVRTIGITAATDASKRSCTPASRATAKSSSPCWASSCLLAVTTGLPARSAARTYSRAGSVPPISSTIRSDPARIESKSPSPRVSTPETSGCRPVAAVTASARAASSSAKAAPTVPRPSSPMRTGLEPSEAIARLEVPRGQVLVGLAADDHAGLAIAAEDDRGTRHAGVVVGHRVAVGAGGGGDEDVADGGLGQHRVADDHVARLAVHAGDRHQRLGRRRGAVGDQRFVVGAVEHRPQVVRHAAVDGDVGAHARDLLDGADAVGGEARVGDQRAPGLDQDPHSFAKDLGDAAHLDVDV